VALRGGHIPAPFLFCPDFSDILSEIGGQSAIIVRGMTMIEKYRDIIAKLVLLEEPFGVRKKAEELGVPKSTLHGILSFLLSKDVLLRRGRQYVVNHDYWYTRILKVYTWIPILAECVNDVFQSQEISVGIFGSFATGMAREGSDIDIWIYPWTPELVSYILQMERMLDKSVDVVKLTDDDIMRIPKEFPVFWSAMTSVSITVKGDDILDIYGRVQEKQVS